MIFVLHLRNVRNATQMSLLYFLFLSLFVKIFLFLPFHQRCIYTECAPASLHIAKRVINLHEKKSYWTENKFLWFCIKSHFQTKKLFYRKKFPHLFVHFISFEFLLVDSFVFDFLFASNCNQYQKFQLRNHLDFLFVIMQQYHV